MYEKVIGGKVVYADDVEIIIEKDGKTFVVRATPLGLSIE